MAYDCLVKKLERTVNKDNSQKLNEALIHISAGSNFNLGIESLQAQTLQIKGDGVFTATGEKTCSIEASPGSSYELPASAKIGMSAGDYILSIPDKRYICTLHIGINNENTDVVFPIEDIAYMQELIYCSFYGASGTCKELKAVLDSCPKISQVFYIGNNLSEDIADLVNINPLLVHFFPQYSSVYGIFPSGGIKMITYENSKNISATTNALASQNTLQVLVGNNSHLEGDIGAFSGLQYLTQLVLWPATQVYGDLSTLPNSLFKFTAAPNTPFTWTVNGRASGATFMGIGENGGLTYAVELGNSVDAMLKNQTTASPTYAYHKVINVTGTSNYANDPTVQAAIRTIRDSFGVDIFINGTKITTSIVPA